MQNSTKIKKKMQLRNFVQKILHAANASMHFLSKMKQKRWFFHRVLRQHSIIIIRVLRADKIQIKSNFNHRPLISIQISKNYKNLETDAISSK